MLFSHSIKSFLGNDGLVAHEQGDAEILTDIRITADPRGAEACAVIFTEATEGNVNKADENDVEIAEHGELQLCTAQDKEQNKDGCCPAVKTIHQLLGEVTDVTEDGPQHHAGEQRGEGNMNATENGEGELHHRAAQGEEHKGNRHRKALGARMEEALKEGE